MSKIISTEEHNNFVVVKTEGYFNKDLGELVISLVEENVKENKYHFILDLEQSKIVNSIGASILIEVIEIILIFFFLLKLIKSANSFDSPELDNIIRISLFSTMPMSP